MFLTPWSRPKIGSLWHLIWVAKTLELVTGATHFHLISYIPCQMHAKPSLDKTSCARLIIPYNVFNSGGIWHSMFAIDAQ